jgi:hypothetical protein
MERDQYPKANVNEKRTKLNPNWDPGDAVY